MELFAGLGNQGEKYKFTRHNAGFLMIDVLAKKLGFETWEVSKKYKSLVNISQSFILAKPQTFMNSSGEAVLSLVNFYKVKMSNLWIIHDDLDIKLGEYKIQLGVGPKVHNGVNSIEEKLGKKDFWRVRIGVDNRAEEKDKRTIGEDYVLQNFTDEEKEIVTEVLNKAADDLSSKIS